MVCVSSGHYLRLSLSIWIATDINTFKVETQADRDMATKNLLQDVPKIPDRFKSQT